MSWGQYPPVVEPMLPHPPDDAVAVDSWAHPMTDVRRRVTQLCTVGLVVVAPLVLPQTTDSGGGTIVSLNAYELTQYQSFTAPMDSAPFLFVTHDWESAHRPMPRLVAPRPATNAIAPLFAPEVTEGPPQPPSAIYPARLWKAHPQARASQTFAAPPYVPDVTHPVTALSHGMVYPDVLFRKTERAADQPVFETAWFVPDETNPVTASSWQGSYPDVIQRDKPRLAWAPFLFRPTGDVVEPVSDRGGGSISTRSRKLWQYQALAGPFVPTAPVVADHSWDPVLVDQPRRLPYPVALRTAWTMDRFDAPAAPTIPDEATWHAVYPSRLPHPRLRIAPSWTGDAKWTAPPTFVDSFGTAFLLNLPAPVRRPVARFQHVWAEPHFVVEVAVPVMSWTGVYLDPPMRRKSFRAVLFQQLAWPSNIADVTQPVQESAWDSCFPEIVWGKRHATKNVSSQTAIFVTDVTVTSPTLAARAIYPDRIHPRRRVSEFKAWTMDATWTAPAAPSVPDLSAPSYPDRVRPRPPLTAHPAHLWPPHVLDVTDPVTPLSWMPQVQAWIPRVSRWPERHEGFTIDTLPHPPIAPVVFIAAWALNANRYVSRPVDLLREPDNRPAIDRAFLRAVFSRLVFSTDRTDR